MNLIDYIESLPFVSKVTTDAIFGLKTKAYIYPGIRFPGLEICDYKHFYMLTEPFVSTVEYGRLVNLSKISLWADEIAKSMTQHEYCFCQACRYWMVTAVMSNKKISDKMRNHVENWSSDFLSREQLVDN